MSAPCDRSQPERLPSTWHHLHGGRRADRSSWRHIFQAYGGRQLGTEAFAPVAQLWTVFFIIATVLLVPVEQYITREVAGGRKVIPGDLVPAMTVLG